MEIMKFLTSLNRRSKKITTVFIDDTKNKQIGKHHPDKESLKIIKEKYEPQCIKIVLHVTTQETGTQILRHPTTNSNSKTPFYSQ